MNIELLSTNGYTSKFRGADCGPTWAFAMPFGPAFEPAGQAVMPVAIRSSALHFFRPLPENFTPFGRSTSIVSTVVLGLLRSVLKLSLTFVGFFAVPASLGFAV